MRAYLNEDEAAIGSTLAIILPMRRMGPPMKSFDCTSHWKHPGNERTWVQDTPQAILLIILVLCMILKTAGGQQSSDQPRQLSNCGNASSARRAEYVMVYRSEQAVVCVEKTFWDIEKNATAIAQFFPYFDKVILQDKAAFQIHTSTKPFVFEITAPTGGAHTGCDLMELSDGGRYCDTVTGDAFSNAYNDPVTHKRIVGFWGYVLPLHESINVFTGLLSNGWPSDWWADHRSPFPNAMDIEFMRSIANASVNASPLLKRALLESAQAQWERYAAADNPVHEYDPQVVMFLGFFEHFGGFAGYKKAFQYAFDEDRLRWPSVSNDRSFTGDDNHSENLSEYIVAYLELGFGTSHDMTSVFRDAGVGTFDKKIPPYKLVKGNIKAIADAHCSIQAATNAGIEVKEDLRSLQLGDFKDALARGGTRESCPAECTFRNTQCEAKF